MRLFEPEAAGPQATPAGGASPEPGKSTSEAALAGPLRRVMLLVAYDGGAFRGFAAQPDQPRVNTVGGALAAALARMVAVPVPLTCAGRTDAGVHATGQVVHVDLPSDAVEKWLARAEATGAAPGELPRLAKSLTSQLGPALVVGRARVAGDGFDARHSALARRYRYRILRSNMGNPLLRSATWQVAGDLDLGAMRIAGDALLGEHDFAAFCRRPPGHEGPLPRRVTDVRLMPPSACAGEYPELVVEIEANAFCHQMVRSIVGALVAVGQSRLTAADVVVLLRAGERVSGGGLAPAPPQGLCLVAVRYPPELVPGGVFLPE